MSLGDYQKNARLMGILYGLLVGMEAQGAAITYDKIVDEMKPYCTRQELAITVQTLEHVLEVVNTSKGLKP